MMSMKGDGKPVSFIEDCAVPLEHLAEYTDRLTRVFEKHGTRGTWYAHASVGTLHVRPILDMRRDGAEKMRAIAEEACAMVREYKGAYSGEHGDGLVRSEWIAPFFGPRLTAALGEIKSWLDPKGLMNPGKIVNPSRMDERELFRFKPGYQTSVPASALDWSEWGGYDKAVEMCNNNGHCRKFDAGTMCPSYRATLDEKHLTRGRANTLAPRAVQSAGRGRRGGCESGARPLRLVQRLQARVPDRGRHGADESRVPRALQGEARPDRARSRDRLSAALCTLGRAHGAFIELARLQSLKSSLGFAAKRALPKWRSDFFRDEGTQRWRRGSCSWIPSIGISSRTTRARR